MTGSREAAGAFKEGMPGISGRRAPGGWSRGSRRRSGVRLRAGKKSLPSGPGAVSERGNMRASDARSAARGERAVALGRTGKRGSGGAWAGEW